MNDAIILALQDVLVWEAISNVTFISNLQFPALARLATKGLTFVTVLFVRGMGNN